MTNNYFVPRYPFKFPVIFLECIQCSTTTQHLGRYDSFVYLYNIQIYSMQCDKKAEKKMALEENLVKEGKKMMRIPNELTSSHLPTRSIYWPMMNSRIQNGVSFRFPGSPITNVKTYQGATEARLGFA